MIVSKELFIEAVNELERAFDYQENLNKFFKNNCSDGYLIQPDCSDMVIKLLENVMKLERNEDGYTDLSYFCLGLEFGRKFVPGCIKEIDEDGNEVELDFSSAEKLYDYLVSKEEGGNSE